jgi:hypothetical protein
MIPRLIRLHSTVGLNGKIEVTVPLAEGTPIKVYVAPTRENDFGDMLIAASPSMNFWDNPIDDETWNNS